ncbi:flagellar biosynthesis anti-sigma factor FlgM [Neobacillus niacini]|uniref:flagellar biosynthesis anti-sigma factor FlgM n=1 Tax=Neobacillus niacini TaxID=86668 RepID=UPI002FFFE1C7
MRINDMQYGLYSYQNQPKQTVTPNTLKKPSASADVQISSRGREMSQAMISEQAQRQQRIQELKQQIATGNYQVDSNKIADKVLDFWTKNSL